MNTIDVAALKRELSLKAKNGVNFLTAAAVIWLAIAYIWTLDFTSYDRSVLTFIMGGFLLPLSFLFSKVFKTQWVVKDNPLDSLGLWLNFAQLFYFPFLVFALIKQPDYFLMTYAIITGAHLFPYAWFYDEKGFAVIAGIISVGALLLGLTTPLNDVFLIAVFTGALLAILAIWVFLSFKAKAKRTLQHTTKPLLHSEPV